jgi:hypothetical protein
MRNAAAFQTLVGKLLKRVIRRCVFQNLVATTKYAPEKLSVQLSIKTAAPATTRVTASATTLMKLASASVILFAPLNSLAAVV